MKITWVPSPNFFSNTGEKTAIVIHKTLGHMPGTLTWLTKPASQVSTHYIITRKGKVYQLVNEKDGAWHCGRENNPGNRWKKLDQPGVNNNRFTIGIEFEALLSESFSNMQYESGAWLLKRLEAHAGNLVTHNNIAKDKPNLEQERTELLRRMDEPPTEPDNSRLIQILKLQIQILMLKLRLLKSRKNK